MFYIVSLDFSCNMFACYYYHPFATGIHIMFGGLTGFSTWTMTLSHGTQTPEYLFRNHWMTDMLNQVIELYCVVLYWFVHYIVLEPLLRILWLLGLPGLTKESMEPLNPSELMWNLSSIDSWEECESATSMHYLWAIIRLGCFFALAVSIALWWKNDTVSNKEVGPKETSEKKDN